ncbi:MAG: histidine triad nucleotide-binding protein [Dehalococcoidia bacterium]|jgi:histidine triad (HIT) family protein|nr:histidine triad nucleotide-binding protein [Dehalococcoidia bacterium]|tara:strand:- start:226 stop:573 length:348 start_codon:yes stop_codon:yes gene_type:complete
MNDTDCIFCGIFSGVIESDVLFRNKDLIVVRDINPKAPTHLIIIPKPHIKNLAYSAGRTSGILGHMFIVAEEMARREEVTISGFRLIVNQGENAGQEIEHLHMHLLGGKKLNNLG